MIALRLLQVLEDVPGVTGSFVMTHAGLVLVQAMPGYFDQAALRLAACRVSRMLACSEANGLTPEDAVFDFGSGKLFVREFVQGYLCVLCDAEVNMRSLRLTARLVARGMPAEIDAGRLPGESNAAAPSAREALR
jgi:predicted regulator of Ras-like GTPase activity (Roadblock/LC7/MglB family)